MAKRYRDSGSTGTAGEYLVGVVASDALGWPYRNQPIADIGIDGEIEILTEDGSSTGEIVKVQVKSTQKDLPVTHYVSQDDYEYWQLLSVPVIVCLASVSERKVYWKHASSGSSTGESCKYEFETKDELEPSSKEEIRRISKSASFNVFDGLWCIVREELEEISRRVPHPKRPEGITNREEIYEGAEEAFRLYKAVQVLEDRFEKLSKESSSKDSEKARELVGRLRSFANYLGRNYEF